MCGRFYVVFVYLVGGVGAVESCFWLLFVLFPILFVFFLGIQRKGVHSRNVESKGCRFMFYGVVRVEVDCCVGSGWFSIFRGLFAYVLLSSQESLWNCGFRVLG